MKLKVGFISEITGIKKRAQNINNYYCNDFTEVDVSEFDGKMVSITKSTNKISFNSESFYSFDRPNINSVFYFEGKGFYSPVSVHYALKMKIKQQRAIEDRIKEDKINKLEINETDNFREIISDTRDEIVEKIKKYFENSNMFLFDSKKNILYMRCGRPIFERRKNITITNKMEQGFWETWNRVSKSIDIVALPYEEIDNYIKKGGHDGIFFFDNKKYSVEKIKSELKTSVKNLFRLEYSSKMLYSGYNDDFQSHLKDFTDEGIGILSNFPEKNIFDLVAKINKDRQFYMCPYQTQKIFEGIHVLREVAPNILEENLDSEYINLSNLTDDQISAFDNKINKSGFNI